VFSLIEEYKTYFQMVINRLFCPKLLLFVVWMCLALDWKTASAERCAPGYTYQYGHCRKRI